MNVNNDVRQAFSIYCYIIEIITCDSVGTPEEAEMFILLLISAYKILMSNGYRIKRGSENGVVYHELTDEAGHILERIDLV